MDQCERRTDQLTCELAGPTGGDPPAADLAPVRQRAQGMVAAAREAIARSLSHRSTVFMRSVVQGGGQ